MAHKRQKKLNMRKVVVRLLFIGVLLYSGYVLASQQVSMYQKQKSVDECNAMISDAKSENARLDEELGLVNTDEYKERKARELLGYIRPDERIYVDVTK